MSNNSNRNALSLLVNAADRSSETNGDGASLSPSNQRQQPQQSSSSNGGGASSSYRTSGQGNNHGSSSLEEQILLQQQQQQYGNLLNSGASGFRSSADSYQMAQLLGGAGFGSNSSSEQQLRLAQQLQQQQQQRAAGSNHHDMLAQLRAGALSGGAASAAWLGAGGGFPYGGGASSAYAADLERLEELARRQRLMQQAEAATYGSSLDAAMAARLGQLSGRGDPLLNSRDLLGPRAMELEQLQQQQREQELVNRNGSSAKSSSGPAEQVQQTAGSVIVPCRARGMPMDHNFKTAYFVIPSNVKHGEELICSYFACRNAGIKFRYCSHCKVPVAKRNFRKRHKHGGDLDVISQSNNAALPPVVANIPSQISAAAKDDDDDDAISSQSNTADSANLAARQATWMALLSQRPSCTTLAQFQDWLERVLAVSSGGATNTASVPLSPEVVQTIWEASTQCQPVTEELIPKAVVTTNKNEDEGFVAKGNTDGDDDNDDVEDGQVKDEEEEDEDEDPQKDQDYSDTEEELSTKRSPKNKFDEWKERKKLRKLEAAV